MFRLSRFLRFLQMSAPISDAVGNPSWHFTRLIIKDPTVTVAFYEKHFGFKLIDQIESPAEKATYYYVGILPEGVEVPGAPGSNEAHGFVNNYSAGVLLQFKHVQGSETDEKFSVNNGNVEPNRGFGHIAVNTLDVYAACAEMEKNGANFQKKPDEGRMKGLAFVKDPDGYWVEVVKRRDDSTIKPKFNLSQTMIRIKDPKRSLEFYQKYFGMTLVSERHFEEAKFSLYFLANLNKEQKEEFGQIDTKTPAAGDFVKGLFNPILELTHNHGSENDDNFKYHNGRDEPAGFQNVSFLVDGTVDKCKELEAASVKILKAPGAGLDNFGTVADPDDYAVQFIQRGLEA